MCGIVGYIGYRRAAKILFSGLKKLEYRGYDSAGISVINGKGFSKYKCVGKINDLIEKIKDIKVFGSIGIGHTRWATHGKPTDVNSHPHSDCKEEINIVHNGIIENFDVLKKQLIDENHVFKSETDTEVIAHLIEKYYENDLFEAVQKTLKVLKGSYAVCVTSINEPDKIICARCGSPLVIGLGENENFIASDTLAVAKYTSNFIFLDEFEIAVLTKNTVDVYDYDKNKKNKGVMPINIDVSLIDKNKYKHFMLKEIYEQPEVISDTIEEKLDEENLKIHFEELNISDDFIKNLNKIHIIACGTAWHAGLVGKYYLEEFSEMFVETAIASEYRYRNVPISEKDLVIIISQSGETADSLAALRKAKVKGAKSLAVCNVRGSTLSRECDGVIYTNAGPEVGVASTKAFTTQLTALYLLSIYISEKKGIMQEEKRKMLCEELLKIPDKIKIILEKFNELKKISIHFSSYKDFLFLGRHYNYPIALEGSLKLKEISYIHAEGYAAGEMKHGPIALITEEMPVVTIAVKSFILDKVISNLQEVKARDGITIIVSNDGVQIPENMIDFRIDIPDTIEPLTPMLTVIPLQILSYQIADFLGCDVDQPRNLAKSVTVE